mmetsp:Transcript_25248/g.35258  ORF Transcript_25248/g.35258 Transcript_25248/m.35258 type:complete len:367 (-) Transcript_25248:270-1370(-)
MADKGEKSTYLILGGTGFIGRNLVQYLAEHKLASKIYVADKKMYSMAYMHEDHQKAFKDKDLVKFYQTDLAQDPHVKKAFTEKVDYVINLCGETRMAMSEKDYQLRIVTPAEKCAKAAAKMGVKKWIEVSTAHVYKENSKKPSDEKATLDPWTAIAKCRLEAEKKVAEVDGLPVVILRPAIVYGKGDRMGLTPRMAVAPVYKKEEEVMKFLWVSGLKLNTVHVEDMCASIELACKKLNPGSTYNVADKGNSDQGLVNGLIGDIFEVKTGFMGWIASKAAAMMLDRVVNSVNERHVPAFTEICQEQKILNTPISPYLDKEVLKNKGLCIDGSAIEKEGLKLTHPKVTKELLEEQLKFMQDQGIFPKV